LYLLIFSISINGRAARQFWAEKERTDMQSLEQNAEKRQQWLSGEAEVNFYFI